MQIVSRPELYPGVCLVSNTFEPGRYVDTEIHTSYVDGRVYISESTVRDMVKLLDLPAPQVASDYDFALLVSIENTLNAAATHHEQSLHHLRQLSNVIRAKFGDLLGVVENTPGAVPDKRTSVEDLSEAIGEAVQRGVERAILSLGLRTSPEDGGAESSSDFTLLDGELRDNSDVEVGESSSPSEDGSEGRTDRETTGSADEPESVGIQTDSNSSDRPVFDL